MIAEWRRTSGVLAVACVITVMWAGAASAAGGLDTNFNGDGKVTTNFTGGFDAAAAGAIQSDGKIVAAGGAGGGGGRFALARYDTDGTPDATFGGDGKVITNFTNGSDSAQGVAIQADGKIVAAGDVSHVTPDGFTVGRFALARYNTDGTLDTTFGGDGKVTTNFTNEFDGAAAVAIQADGQIVAAGSANAFGSGVMFALARYNTDGTLDTTFGGGDGRVSTHFRLGAMGTAMSIETNGRIVVAGGNVPDADRFELARYDTDGTLDATFSGNGKVSTHVGPGETSATSVAIQANGKIVAAGYTNVPHEFGDRFGPGRFALARYLADGTLDSGFGGDGKVTTTFGRKAASANGLAIRADGKIVAVGEAGGGGGRFALGRYNLHGALDTTFGRDGKVTTNFTAREDIASGVVIQANGKIVAVGEAGGGGGRFALSRYLGG
jgi:uncharacterized delta-60 repeat protein